MSQRGARLWVVLVFVMFAMLLCPSCKAKTAEPPLAAPDGGLPPSPSPPPSQKGQEERTEFELVQDKSCTVKELCTYIVDTCGGWDWSIVAECEAEFLKGMPDFHQACTCGCMKNYSKEGCGSFGNCWEKCE
jgi:hypothetical protein